MDVTAYPRLRAALPVGPVVPLPEPSPGVPEAVPGDDPEALTRDLLRRAADRVGPGARVVAFRRWWDGDAWVPLLAVRIAGRPAWVVESGGAVHVLPARPGLARRVLRRSRPRPSGAPLAPPRARACGSIAVGTPTRPAVEVLRGALSPRQQRERAAARRRAVPRADGPADQLGLFAEAGHETAGSPRAPAAAAGARAGDAAPARVVRVVQGGDAVRCGRMGCGALVPVPPPGAPADEAPVCPLCASR